MDKLKSTSRRLACIMFTDIVGYTSLMGEDEQLALKILEKNRKIQKPIIEEFGGTWIKELGDGVLATFQSATDSVLAAASIQVAIKDEAHLKLRIGLHLSEVIFENDDVFGDGVNIASRIQSSAPVGAIIISDAVQKNIANKKGIETRLVGHEKLKNVKEEVRLFEVIITEDFIGYNITKVLEEIAEPIVSSKSIAVLPFRNLNTDPDQEYFSDGMAEEILITLSNIEGLKVIGRSSSFQFKGSSQSISELGALMGVSTILEGSVRKHDNGLRINAQLINVKDGRQLWAERYDREMTDVFEIQDDIASKIANKLKVTFFGEEKRTLPTNMEAYELVLKGRFYVEKYVEGFDKALACFTLAIELDPNYAEAYAELAKLHFLFTMNLFHSPREGFEKAKYYAERALILNSELGGAHYVLGQIYFWYLWDFKKSKRQYELAQNARVSFYFSGVVMDPWYNAFAYGDYDSALQSVYKTLENDPFSFFAMLHLGYFYTFGKKPDQAREVLNKILMAVPTFSEAERLLAYNSFFEDDTENAIKHARKAAALAHGLGWAQNFLIIALAKNGDHEEARELLYKWENVPGPLNISPIGIGLVHTYLGDFDKAFEYLEKGLVYRDIWVLSLKYSPEYEPLRKDPRFDKLVAKIGFPEVQTA